MEVYKIGPATVRMHGKPDPDRLTESTAAFLKRVEAKRRQKRKAEQEEESKRNT